MQVQSEWEQHYGKTKKEIQNGSDSQVRSDTEKTEKKYCGKRYEREPAQREEIHIIMIQNNWEEDPMDETIALTS